MDFVTNDPLPPQHRQRSHRPHHHDKENARPGGRSGKSGNGPVSLGGVVAAGAAALGAGLVRSLVQRQRSLSAELATAQGELAAASAQMQEMAAQLGAAREELAASVAALEKREAELEAARGELGLTASKMSVIERELAVTKRSLSSYQAQLERSRMEGGGGGVHPPSPLGLWGS